MALGFALVGPLLVLELNKSKPNLKVICLGLNQSFNLAISDRSNYQP